MRRPFIDTFVAFVGVVLALIWASMAVGASNPVATVAYSAVTVFVVSAVVTGLVTRRHQGRHIADEDTPSQPALASRPALAEVAASTDRS